MRCGVSAAKPLLLKPSPTGYINCINLLALCWLCCNRRNCVSNCRCSNCGGCEPGKYCWYSCALCCCVAAAACKYARVCSTVNTHRRAPIAAEKQTTGRQ